MLDLSIIVALKRRGIRLWQVLIDGGDVVVVAVVVGLDFLFLVVVGLLVLSLRSLLGF